MNASELRIGNLVNYLIIDELDDRKKWYEPMKIDYDDFRILLIKDEINEDYYKPIPLNEEWLLKFGFFKHNNAYVLEKPKNNIMNFKFSIWNDFTYNSAEFPQQLDYVHQLQNLYYALTKKEL